MKDDIAELVKNISQKALRDGFNICVEQVLDILKREDLSFEQKVEVIKSLGE